MRIAILTSGRFHVCDLARELASLNHEVAFYSYVPKARTRQFGLPDRCHRSLLKWLAPFVALSRCRLIQGTSFQQTADEVLIDSLDFIASRVITPCDVFIGMSGMSSRSAEAVRKKYGARILIERGSRHILSQKEILENMPGTKTGMKPVSESAVLRELSDYNIADTIVVPSSHVEQSFLERNIPSTKLFRNPYGVSLDQFKPTTAPDGPPTIIMVGHWSKRKGCDILVRAWQKLKGVKLLHVGLIGDEPLPQTEGFEHHDQVDQPRLAQFYARAHVFALASREEGLAVVQAQALACGLRVVCTDRTGGADLKAFLSDPGLVTVVPHDNHEKLAEALAIAIEKATIITGLRDTLGNAREQLSWRSYGERYHRELIKV